MNKYFYPIYKMKLKPWIKYWLLKKLNGSGESTLKAVTISSGTLKKVDKSKVLSIKEYYGNTIQNGTPTPEAPVEIQTISGDNTFTINNSSYRVELGNIELCKIGNYQDKLLQSKGNNLFDKDNANTLDAFVYGNTGLLATPTSNQKSLAIPIQPNTQYTISGVERSASNYGLYSDTTLVIGTSIATTKGQIRNGTMTFTSGVNDKWLVFLLRTGSETYGYSNVMLNKGTTALPYEPYGLGKWYIEKRVGKVVLNGSENWGVFFSTNGVFISNSTIISINSASTINCISNYYANTYSRAYIRNNLATVDNACATTNNELIIANKSITSVADFKTWLSNNNTTVYYVLANPTYTEITDTYLLEQLNALYDFYVNSSIVSISNNSEIQLEVLLEYYGR